MKDRQIQQGAPPIRIPVISPALHCVSMTVIVFMRSSFGFVYLRPRSVFFGLSWVFALFTAYAWIDRRVWNEYWPVCIFGVMATALYWSHLLIAFFREIYRTGAHDHDSGSPHAIRILRILGKTPTSLFDKNWRIWIEPLIVLAFGLALRFAFEERHLSSWFLFVAPCFSLKEALNFWFQIRKEKSLEDSRSDATDMFGSTSNIPDMESPRAVGKEKVRRPRASQ